MQAITIKPNDSLFILTGAGISAESGISTFRDPAGLWQGFRPEDVATPEAWRRDAEMVWRFYSSRRRTASECRPNPAHFALATLENAINDRLFLCTQNVDNLHELAGSKRVTHMHGELFKSRCERECGKPPIADENSYAGLAQVPRCLCGGRMRPHVCWFGEMPYDLDRIFDKLENCTVFLTVGSSGTVEPAASFPVWAGQHTFAGRARCYYVGAEEPANSAYFDECFIGRAGAVLPGIFQLLP